MISGVFDLFKIGIGPSSSHTVGPMVAARRFGQRLHDHGVLAQVAHVDVALYGSLALTGKGHATDSAVILGLSGEVPALVDPEQVPVIVAQVHQAGRLLLMGAQPIEFVPARDIHFWQRERKPFHSNAMVITARDAGGTVLDQRHYYSIGGGFVLDEDEALGNERAGDTGPAVPHDFASADALLAIGTRDAISFAEIMLANECARRPLAEIEAGLDLIADTMAACIDRGCRNEGVLPGGLKVPRRAAVLTRELALRQQSALGDPLVVLDWINLWAMAVNEENAAGGKVVTAPTNGAAGIIPAVLRYYDRCYRGTREGRHTFLLTAAAIGALYKRNASISGAEVGCQGEVGVACSMAAGGLTAALGGNNGQIENAAEIAMEHNLGLTCDPVGGLVQIPCIERNAMGAVKAIDASRLALLGDGTHMVSLDKVIETMRQTGYDMRDKYKETSQGGLAVNVVEC
ncbi:L-serine ammonia-lyase [Novosphingobium sp.]|uniref:L-serine ammonia-lyase n=1 Tax=Novosphingobium sp. TaxID=1874826 RepID=UPI003341CD16